MFYCLGNNDKEKLCICSLQTLPSIFFKYFWFAVGWIHGYRTHKHGRWTVLTYRLMYVRSYIWTHTHKVFTRNSWIKLLSCLIFRNKVATKKALYKWSMLLRALQSRAKYIFNQEVWHWCPYMFSKEIWEQNQKNRRVLHPQSYASTHLALPAPPQDLQKVRRNVVRTGGRVKEAHCWDLDSYCAIISCVYTKCINSTNLKNII